MEKKRVFLTRTLHDFALKELKKRYQIEIHLGKIPISKTKLRLANSIGIIDSGYRGNIIGVFDILSSNDSNTRIEKLSRLLQICSGDLQPFIVKMVEDLTLLGLTNRGMGGFGSTGI